MFASKDLFFSKPSGYQISRSVRLRASASAYFNRTPASAGNQKTWTQSFWFKRGQLGVQQDLYSSFYGGDGSNESQMFFNSSDQFAIYDSGASAGYMSYVTTQVFRDPSAWYHFVIACDTTQATASNRLKIYVNGVQITSFATSQTQNQNNNTGWNGTSLQRIGMYARIISSPTDGYFAEFNNIDGQALTPSSFGQTNTITGVWQPLKYTGTYGTNGFYLNFSDNSNNTATTIGKDYSGNGNNWTPNNISVTAGVTYDSMLDVPTLFADGGNGRGNYAVMNPVSGYSVTLTNGNLTYTTGTSSNPVTSTWSLPTTGKWYWEVTVSSVGEAIIGIQTRSNLAFSGPKTGYYRAGGASNGIYIEGSTNVYAASSYTNGDVIAVAFNADSSQISWYKNNVQQGGPYSLTSIVDLTPILIQGSGTGSNSGDINFGQRPFTYTPPTGFVALNTQNLPTPTISNGATVMAASTYTGTGATQSIVNSGNNAGAISFKPDWVWIKSRSAATDHKLTDSVRGVTKALISDTTGIETTDANGLTAFNSNGFTVGTDTNYNNNTATYVAWQWQAGQGSTSSNTSGSITSTVSVNATAGFSIVTYTGTGANATVGHGLGVAPKMIIIKARSRIDDWIVYHESVGNTKYLLLDTTAASALSTAAWNNTSPTSTVFTIGTQSNGNTASSTNVAYCFAAVAGYSAFGSYTGNGAADGPFVYCGFRPRWVMVKYTGGVGDWSMVDTSRNTYNVADARLDANLSSAELVLQNIDVTSNGFKVRTTNTNWNTSSGTIIFAAFAENPFKYSLAR